MSKPIDKPLHSPVTPDLERLNQQQRQQQEVTKPAVESERDRAIRRARQQDASRLVSQLGVKPGAWAKSKFAAGEYARQPIPLDPSDVDESLWSSQALDRVTSHLTLKVSSFKEIARQVADKGTSLPVALLSSAFKITEDDLEKLEALSELEAQALSDEELEEVCKHLETLFDVKIPRGAPRAGQILLAASLVVAGLREDLEASGGDAGDADGGPSHAELEATLAQGAARILEQGKAAVEVFRRMQEGISKEVGAFRTLVPRR